MRTCLLFCFLITTWFSLWAQQLGTDEYNLRLEELEGEIYAVCGTGGEELNAKVAALQDFTRQQQDWEQYFQAYFWNVYCHDEAGRLEPMRAGLDAIDSALVADSTQLPPQDLLPIQISAWFYRAVYFYKLGDLDHALDFFAKTEEAVLRDGGEDLQPFLTGIYRYLGSIYRSQGNTQAAIETYQTAASFSQQTEQNADWGLYNKYLGDAYQEREEFDQALRYYLIALEENERAFRRNRRDDRLRNRVLTSLNALASVYLQKDMSDSSLYYLRRSLRLQPEGYLFLPQTHQLLGEVYARQANFRQAQFYYQQALKGKEARFGRQSVESALTLRSLGDLLLQQNEPALGLTFYQQSLESLVPGFSQAGLQDNPHLRGLYSRKELLLTLRQKAYGLQALAEKEPEHPLPLRQLALQTTQLAVALIDSLKLGYEAETDKQFLLSESYPLFELGLNLCYQLHQQEGQPEYLAEAFRLAEKSRAVVLYESQKQARARTFAGIPEELQQQEKQLLFQLTNLQDSLQILPDPTQRQDLFEQFAGLKEEYQQLLRRFETDYPNYYRLKYDVSVLGLAAAQQELLNPQAAILEFFVGDEYLFLLDIRQNEVALHRMKRDFPLEDWIAELREGIYGYFTSSQSLGDEDYALLARQFCARAHDLFRTCLAPYQKELSLPTELIIIPDGMLGYVPFSALLKEPVGDPQKFRDHPYLLREHQISYSYSVSLLEEMKKAQSSATNRRLLAFAPIFEGEQAPLRRGAEEEERLSALPYTRKEVASIAEIMTTEAFLEQEATRSQFMALAPDFPLIHLATHGILNDKDPDRSYLAFSAGPELNQDTRLYVRDLYAMRLQSELVVLSACETGIGQLSRGEGLLSLARGFSYAGARSLLTTLWSIPDGAASSGLLPDYYTQLQNGAGKAAALRQAQLGQIDNAFTENLAHPFYWAAFIPVGDMSPLQKDGINWFWAVLGGLLAIGVILLRERRRRRD